MIRPRLTLILLLAAFFSLGMGPRPKPQPGDTTPPQVSISSPANNATVSGTVNIQATATDNVGVTKVEFYVDNSLKSTDTSLPYAYSWDSSTATNASHALKVTAYDAKDNSKQAQISVTVKNTATPPPTPPTPPPVPPPPPPTPPTPPPPTPPPTPPVPSPAEEEIKISSAVVSSYYSSSKAAAQTIDNYFSTYWEGKYRVSWFNSKVLTSWWLRLDLDKPYNLFKISIWWYKGFGASNYSIQGSNDYQTWTNIQSSLSSAGGNTNPYQTDHVLTGSYRYIRISINKAQASYPRIYEVKLYSKPLDTTPPVIVITSPQDGAAVEGTSVQLKGSVDGVSFSESRALSFGENILTKTAVDAAGNKSSVSIKVYFSLGQLIGPEGGEVTSADGRVRVIIPSGAVDKPTKIEASTNIDNEVLNKFKSSGKTLLSVVRCERYPNPTDSFKKPITLVYALEQVQVPGTPVILGLYDGDGGISFTGDPSFVAEDGVTATFKIGHFSTYGALQSMVSQGAPIGSGVKIPLPDMFTGSFSHSIPLTIPPGRKSMQPSLSLNYRSSNSNSWVGVGFSLNPGYIVRSTRLGPPKYTDDDTFYLVTDGGTTEMTRLTEKLYQAKIESSFTKFYKEENGSWRVVAKDGSELLFGDSVDSREVASKGTFAWYLTKAQDTNGNYITYAYWPKEQDNKCYLRLIDYTGNKNAGKLPLNSVEFFLEGREDAPSSYLSGSKIAIAKRLKEIVVRANLELVWTYKLEYKYCEDTNRSFIKSITQSGSDGKSFPAQVFDYQKPR